MTNYPAIAAAAQAALVDNGFSATLHKAGGRDLSGALPVLNARTQHPVTVLQTARKQSDSAQGDNVASVERVYLLDPLAGVVPTIGDRLDTGDGTRDIVMVHQISPGNLAVLYRVGCGG